MVGEKDRNYSVTLMTKPVFIRDIGDGAKFLMINIGLVLLQKESKYEASLYESFCLRRRSEVNLLPSGYPQRKPDTITMEPYSDT